MTTWSAFHHAEPELAERARSILSSTTNNVLGTIRADGSPRLSGIDPWFADGELWIGSMPGARKAADLARDPRCSLHSVPWESRRPKEGATNPGDADAKVSAIAVRVTDEAEQRRAMATFMDERGFEPDEVGDLFRIEPEAVTLVFVDDEQLVVDRWSAANGRKTVRRT